MKTGETSASSSVEAGSRPRHWYDAVSSVAFVGFLPLAPGTWGSAVALGVWFILRLFVPLTSLLIGTVLLFFLGVYTSFLSERGLAEKDPGWIVIDEWVGQWLACWWIPLNGPSLGVAFVLFRLFDIWKPWPVRKFDQYSGGWGIMLDDVAAGLLALAGNGLIHLFWL